MKKQIFKKGEYVVITKGNNGNFRTNYIMKQRKDSPGLQSELDISGSLRNGLDSLRADGTGAFKARPATKKEISAYLKAGKPIDVTKIKEDITYISEVPELLKFIDL